MLGDEENDYVKDKTRHEYRLISSDVKDMKILEAIIEYANDAYEENKTDKEICTKLKKLLDSDKEILNNPSNPQGVIGSEQLGVWQVIIGRQFCASITFDAELFVYFEMPIKHSKYFLVFRS